MSSTGTSTVPKAELLGAEALATIASLEKRFKVSTVRSADGILDLRYGVLWEGPGDPERYLLLINGRAEWLEKYCYVPGDLGLPSGTAVLAWDHRGQGLSGGARAFVDSYDSYAADAATIIKAVVGTKPYAAMAHSMGALITLYATLTGRIQPRSIVLSSPLLGLPQRPIPPVVAKPLSKLLTRCRLGPVSSGAGGFTEAAFAANDLTHHAGLYQRMQAEERFKIPGATFGWVAATFNALDLCHDPQRLAALTVPTLVLSAEYESVVDPEAARLWAFSAAKHAKTEVQHRIISGARHELWSEIPTYYEPTLNAIRGWLQPIWGLAN